MSIYHIILLVYIGGMVFTWLWDAFIGFGFPEDDYLYEIETGKKDSFPAIIPHDEETFWLCVWWPLTIALSLLICFIRYPLKWVRDAKLRRIARENNLKKHSESP